MFDSIGRRTQAYRDELAQDRHVVRVEHAEADAETEPRTHGCIHAVPEAQQHQSRDHQSQADGTRVDTPAEVALDPPVGERAADHYAEERREGNRKGRYRSGRGHRHPEAVGEERRQPVLGGPSGQRRRSEVKEHNPEGDVREQQPKAAPHREVRLGACGLGLRLPGPAVLMQEEDQHDGIGDADDAEPVEGLLPGKHRGDRSPESAHGLSDIESGHVDADGETPGLARVVVGDQRKAGRNVERLADAHQGPQQ